MKEKDNKGFWDRWAKRYDFMMYFEAVVISNALHIPMLK